MFILWFEYTSSCLTILTRKWRRCLNNSTGNTFPLFYWNRRTNSIWLTEEYLPVFCRPGISFNCISERVVSGIRSSKDCISCRTVTGFLWRKKKLVYSPRRIVRYHTRWSLSPGLDEPGRRSFSIEASTFSLVDVIKLRSICK